MTTTSSLAGQAKVLLTGFGSFGPHTLNPSAVAAAALDGEVIGKALVVGRLFETSTATVAQALTRALDEVEPVLLICLGLAPGRPALSLERIAANVRDFPIADYDGTILRDVPVIEGAPDGVFSGLPLRAILARWQGEGIPGHISDTAGTYLCNQLFYLACDAGRRRGIPAGFIHIPDSLQSAAVLAGSQPQPTMEQATMERGIRLAIETCLNPDASDLLLSTTGTVA